MNNVKRSQFSLKESVWFSSKVQNDDSQRTRNICMCLSLFSLNSMGLRLIGASRVLIISPFYSFFFCLHFLAYFLACPNSLKLRSQSHQQSSPRRRPRRLSCKQKKSPQFEQLVNWSSHFPTVKRSTGYRTSHHSPILSWLLCRRTEPEIFFI